MSPITANNCPRCGDPMAIVSQIDGDMWLCRCGYRHQGVAGHSLVLIFSKKKRSKFKKRLALVPIIRYNIIKGRATRAAQKAQEGKP